jgi:hypothetical protein
MGAAEIPAKTWRSVVTNLHRTCGTTRTVIDVQAHRFSLTFIDRSASRSAQPDLEAALFMASATGKGRAIREMVRDCGAKVDASDDGRRMPLVYASTCGQVEAVALLMALGASPRRSDADGFGPIQMAVEKGHGGHSPACGGRGKFILAFESEILNEIRRKLHKPCL